MYKRIDPWCKFAMGIKNVVFFFPSAQKGQHKKDIRKWGVLRMKPMVDARHLTCETLRNMLEPYRKPGEGLKKVSKAVLLEKCKKLGLDIEPPVTVEPPCSSAHRWIPLRNRSREVVAWTLVDGDDYDSLMKFSWSLLPIKGKKYAKSDVKGLMHRHLLGDSGAGEIVDHVNGDGLDNTRANIRFATHRLNAQNKCKKEGTSSRYYGVSSSPWGWTAKHGIKSLGYYETEIEAAWAYDEFIRREYAGKGKINGIDKPESFVDYVSRKLTCQSRGVSMKGHKKYMASFWVKSTKSHVNLGTYKTEEEASRVYEKHRKGVEDREALEWRLRPIIRNEQGIAMIPLSTANGRPQQFTLVDDDRWHVFMKRKWHIDNTGYAAALRTRMHAEVLKVPKGFVVDHINGNKLDNRSLNLRQATHGNNNHNRDGRTKTGFKGVVARKKFFRVKLTFDKKTYEGGQYIDQEIAAFAYNCLAKQLYGEYAKLNDVEAPKDLKWNPNKMRLQKILL